MSKVLVVDDEHAICQALSRFLTRQGHTPLIASNGREAVELVRREEPDAVFLDVRMPGMDGLETLRLLHGEHPRLPVLMMTAYGTMETALAAVRAGAFDYLGKPLELAKVEALLRRALGHAQAAPALEAEDSPAPPSTLLIGQSAPMQELFKLMALVTDKELTVLILGESGVGKELVALGIHRMGRRAREPFVAVNCAAIPEALLESELFGHERGAFTGAADKRIGRLEAAARGTLLLDEIGELPLLLQGKLLRVLQERRFERLGSNQAIALEARVVAATNRDLEAEVAAGRFRDDLYHRLNLVTLRIPPLRERRDDIPALAVHFLRQAERELDRPGVRLDASALERLRHHHWPGNVRELEHVIKRAVLAAPGPLITAVDLDLQGLRPRPLSPSDADETGSGEPPQEGDDAGCALAALDACVGAALRSLVGEAAGGDGAARPFHFLMERVERRLISDALEMSGGNQVAASRLLRLHRTTLRKKMPSA